MALREGDKVRTVASECWTPSANHAKLWLGTGHGEVSGKPFTNRDISFMPLIQIDWVEDTNQDETPTVTALYFPLNAVHKVKVRRAELVRRIAQLEGALEEARKTNASISYRLARVENHLYGTNSLPEWPE